jgi:uncharacterized membrane protein
MRWLLSLPKEISVILMASLPVFELRGAIPLGFYLNIPCLKTFILAISGNMLPVIPLLVFLKPVSEKLRRIPLCKRFFDWLFERTKQRTQIVQRYEALGLALFVSIPLPITGAWTGAVAASLFKIRFRYALLAIFSGVLMAGVIVSILCSLGKLTWHMIG